MSEGNCPEVFKDDYELREGRWIHETGKPTKVIEGVDYSGLEEKIKKAAKMCPVEVIKYDEDNDDQKNAPPLTNR